MKSISKKLISIGLIVVLCLAFTACSKNEKSKDVAPANDPVLEQLVKAEGDNFVKSFEESFKSGSSGRECKCELKVSGTSMIINCCIQGVDNVNDTVKSQLQEVYNQQKEDLKEGFKDIKELAPNLSKVIMNVCEEDGDVLAKVELDF